MDEELAYKWIKSLQMLDLHGIDFFRVICMLRNINEEKTHWGWSVVKAIISKTISKFYISKNPKK